MYICVCVYRYLYTTYKNVICTVAYLLESQGLFRRLKCFLTNTITLLLIMAPSKPDPHSQCLDGRVFTVAGLELFSHRVSYFWLQRKYFCPSRACWSLSVGFRETILSAHVSSPSSQVLWSCWLRTEFHGQKPPLPLDLLSLAGDWKPDFSPWEQAFFQCSHGPYSLALLVSPNISALCGRPFVFPPEGFLTPTEHK